MEQTFESECLRLLTKCGGWRLQVNDIPWVVLCLSRCKQLREIKTKTVCIGTTKKAVPWSLTLTFLRWKLQYVRAFCLAHFDGYEIREKTDVCFLLSVSSSLDHRKHVRREASRRWSSVISRRCRWNEEDFTLFIDLITLLRTLWWQKICDWFTCLLFS